MKYSHEGEENNNMHRQKNHQGILFRLILTIFAICLFTIPSSAQDPDGENRAGTIGLTLIRQNRPLSKAYFRYDLNAGQKSSDSIMLFNNSTNPVNVVIYPADLRKNRNGSLIGTTQNAQLSELGSWITLKDNEVSIPPGQRRMVNFDISVPDDCPAGDHVGFIFVEPADDDPQEAPVSPGEEDQPQEADRVRMGMRVRYRIGITVWQRTPGESSATVDFLPVEKIFDKGRLFLKATAVNRGNLLVKSIVGWRLTDTEGNEYLNREPAVQGYLMPDSEMDITIPVVSERPLPRSGYRLEVSLADEKSDLKEIKIYDLTLP